MIVDRMVQVRVAPTASLVVSSASLSSKHAVPSAVGDASKLLDIDVDEFSRRFHLVAARLWLTHGQARGAIDVF